MSAVRGLLGQLCSEELFFDGVHPTAAGHRAYATALVERIQPLLETRAAR